MQNDIRLCGEKCGSLRVFTNINAKKTSPTMLHVIITLCTID